MDKTSIGIIAFIVLFVGIVYSASNTKTENANNEMQPQITVFEEPETAAVQSKETENGGDTMNDNFKIEDTQVGTGDLATAGKTITVHYTGTLTDGTKFDSSVDRGEPFVFVLGSGQVIEGWEKGFDGMKVGGKRKLTIPASMGYGNRAIGGIPANSTLLFDVELLKVE